MTESDVHEDIYLVALLWAIVGAAGAFSLTISVTQGALSMVALGVCWALTAALTRLGAWRMDYRLKTAQYFVAIAALVCSLWALGLAIRYAILHGFTLSLNPEPGKTYRVKIGALLLLWALPTVSILVTALSALMSAGHVAQFRRERQSLAAGA